MKKTAVKILSALLMLSMVFSSNVFAAEKTNSAWDSFLGLFSGNVTTAADTQIDGITYRTHIQNDGWAQGWVSDGYTSGSEGRSLRLEGIEIKIAGSNLPAGIGVTYRTQIENEGWLPWETNGDTSGSVGKGLRLEGIEIKLTGDKASDYSVRYKTHIQNKGWETDWAYDGALSGTVGEWLRLEGIQIEIVQKEADLTAYNAALAAVTKADYTAASWTAYQAVVTANPAATTDLQSKVDAATAAITAAQANLVLVPKVTSVTAINATQAVVTFNSAVDKATLFADGTGVNSTLKTLGAGPDLVVKFASLDSIPSDTLTGVLSTDGKTLTITSVNPLSKRYDVTIDGLKATNANLFVKYTQMITIAADTTAPTIVSTVKTSADKVKVTFSEPMQAFAGATFKYADGTAVTAGAITGSVAAGANEVVYTMSSAVTLNKSVVATIIGAQDMAGNLLTPNPATVSFSRTEVDGIMPAISTVTQTGAKEFTVKFTSGIQNTVADLATKITVSNQTAGATAVTGVVQDTTDTTKYAVTVNNVLDSVSTVTVASGIINLSGTTTIAALTYPISFTADTAAPKVVSAQLVKGTDNIEYLEITYDKDVTAGSLKITGSSVKNYITTAVSVDNVATAYATTTSKKVVRAAASAFAPTEGAVYTVNAVKGTVGGLTSITLVAPATATATFTRGTDGTPANTTVLAQPTITQTTNNTVTVTFTGKVDGSSATTLANYSVAGAVISSIDLAAATGVDPNFTQVVTLNLAQDSNTFTGKRNITVQNVKALGSTVTMVPFTETNVSLNENVRPTVTSATWKTATTIELVFSEDMTKAAVEAATSLDVKSGTTVLPVTSIALAADLKTATITLTSAPTPAQLTTGLTVTKGTTDMTDTLLNIANFTSIAVK